MTKVVLQPCGDGLPAKHYADTVQMLVPLARMAPFLSKDDLTELQREFPGKSAAVWGVTPGKKSGSKKKWERMDPGDVALFARRGRIFGVGNIAMKTHNPKLARELWKENEEGDTWEYMYFLENIREVDVPYEQFNAAVGYKSNNVIQGFDVLPEEKSRPVLRLLKIATTETPGEEALKEIGKAVAETGEFDPDSEGEGRRRTLAAICKRQGQPKFRRELIEAYSGRCGISGCNAIQTLEAAHIMDYNGPKTNHPANGILLRADLHVLFDLGLMTVDPSQFTVILAPSLRATPYAEFEGKKLTLPSEPNLRPNEDALKKHKTKSGL